MEAEDDQGYENSDLGKGGYRGKRMILNSATLSFHKTMPLNSVLSFTPPGSDIRNHNGDPLYEVYDLG